MTTAQDMLPTVFLPGFLCDERVWADTISQLTISGPHIPLHFKDCKDLQDMLAMIDWLNGPGKVDLNVNRLYVVGYSKGAILATLANLHRPATAYVSLNGLADPPRTRQVIWSAMRL